VRARRAEPGGDILIRGSLALMRSLLEVGEVDELDLSVAPIALGAGTPLVAPAGRTGCGRSKAEVWPSAVHVRYEVVPRARG
jgi:dihydrofolate reductase